MPSPPGYTEGDWDEIVEWLKDAMSAGTLGTGIPAGQAAVEEYAKRRAGELIGMHFDAVSGAWLPSVTSYALDDYLREALSGIIESGIKSGFGYAELRNSVEAFLGDEIPGRALMIARTETGIAYNLGAVAGYAAQGVEKVIVHDGQEANSCADCAALEGAEWTVQDAAEDPLGHPNCSRAFEPVVPESWLDLEAA